MADFVIDAEARKIIEAYASMRCYIYITPNSVNVAVRNFYEGEPEPDGIGWAVRIEFRNVAWINVTAYNWNLSDAIRAAHVLFGKAKAAGDERREGYQKDLDALRKKLAPEIARRRLAAASWTPPPPPLPPPPR